MKEQDQEWNKRINDRTGLGMELIEYKDKLLNRIRNGMNGIKG